MLLYNSPDVSANRGVPAHLLLPIYKRLSLPPAAMRPRECPCASAHSFAMARSCAMALCRQPSCLGPLHGQVGDGKMVCHVGMGKWAGQVGMRTQTRAHGAAPGPGRDT